MSFTVLDGMANPIPMFVPPLISGTEVFKPITFPSTSNKGPPEFPVLIAASVWIKSSTNSSWFIPKSLPLEDIIPVVTVPPKPRGLPMAITTSPIRDFAESPKATKGSFCFTSIFSRARSVLGSVPTIFAGNSVLSESLTYISSEPVTTWSLVIICPSSSRINPDPKAKALLLLYSSSKEKGTLNFSKKSLNLSSGNISGNTDPFWLVSLLYLTV